MYRREQMFPQKGTKRVHPLGIAYPRLIRNQRITSQIFLSTILNQIVTFRVHNRITVIIKPGFYNYSRKTGCL